MANRMTTFITTYNTKGSGPRLAVKDLIDMEGEVTTAGCRAVAATATPALVNAECLTGALAAEARIVGRTNLHELALGVTGINQWYGTPVNPLDPTRVPGGSSSGSAVAVANDDADVAYGSDTGGSIRIPAACCGIAGLKTTWGRIPLTGVWPLAPSFDTIGPMARDIAGLVLGMQLLEPGFTLVPTSGVTIGRLRPTCDPLIDAAMDEVLSRTEWDVTDLEVPEWDQATNEAGLLLVAEAWETNRELVARDPNGIGDSVRERLQMGQTFSEATVSSAWEGQRRWVDVLNQLFTRFTFLVTPTLTIFPPTIEEASDLLVARCTLPVNLAGVPALSLPVPTTGSLPASLQLIGPAGSEERLLAAGAWLEAAAR
ncbi:MAG TPA: amidase [Acidimicrobiales bacterium]